MTPTPEQLANNLETGTVQYMVTAETCRAGIRGVCPGCGGQLEPIETVDNSRRPTFWPGCLKCNHFDNGVDPKVFSIAAQLFEDGERPYTHLDRPREDSPQEYRDYYRSAQVRGLCCIVRRVLYLNDHHLRGDDG